MTLSKKRSTPPLLASPALAWLGYSKDVINGSSFMLATIGAVILTLFVGVVSKAYRQEQEGKSKLSLTYQNEEPWKKGLLVDTQPKTNPNAPREQWVKCDSWWYRLVVTTLSPVAIARGVKVYLTEVEFLENDEFKNLNLGTSQQLRWAEQIPDPYGPRDIHPDTRWLIDLISVDNEHHKIGVKWLSNFFVHDPLFEKHGTYRITVIAAQDAGASQTMKLIMKWDGNWQNLQMKMEAP